MDNSNSTIPCSPDKCPNKDVEGYCLIVTQVTGEEYYPTYEDCALCSLDKKPQSLNTWTRGLSDHILTSKGLPPLQEKTRLGSRLGWMISWFVDKPNDCNCPGRIEIMDAWGWAGCRRNRKTIHHWLRESAHQNNIDVKDRWITLLLIILLGPP